MSIARNLYFDKIVIPEIYDILKLEIENGFEKYLEIAIEKMTTENQETKIFSVEERSEKIRQIENRLSEFL